jgi:predicted metal-dependent phosphoesterase TrpH
MSPEDVLSFASRLNLDAISITDHDEMRGIDAAMKVIEQYKVELIPGVELSTTDAQTKRPVHLLVYLPVRTEQLSLIFKKTAAKRQGASEEMIERLGKHFPIDKDTVRRYSKNSSSIFRVHIMRSLVEMGYADSLFGETYMKYLSQPHGCCYVSFNYTNMEEAALAARKSGGVTVMAHPSVYNSFDAAYRLAKMNLLDGIECCYPRCRSDMSTLYSRLIDEFQLIPTSGTDFHGMYSRTANTLGAFTTSSQALRRILDCAARNKADFNNVEQSKSDAAILDS